MKFLKTSANKNKNVILFIISFLGCHVVTTLASESNDSKVLGHFDTASISGNRLSLHGWIVNLDNSVEINAIVVKADSNVVYEGVFEREPRPDVIKALQIKNLENPGWMVDFELQSPTIAEIKVEFKLSDGKIVQLPNYLFPSFKAENNKNISEKYYLCSLLFLTLCFIGVCIAFGWKNIIEKVLLLNLLLVLCLNLYLAFFSKFNVHPDEHGHFYAASFYDDHWFKKKVEHPDMLKSLDGSWGWSYLFLNDKTYFLYNKVAFFIEKICGNKLFAYRIINISLFFFLIVFAFLLREKNLWFFLPVCLVPQVWYIFSYLNGDALSYALAYLLAVFTYLNMDKIIYSLTEKKKFNNTILYLIIIVVALSFVRLQYLLVVPFVFCVLLIKIIMNPKLSQKRYSFLKMFCIIVVAIFPLVVDKIWDELQNNFCLNQSINALNEKYAIPVLSKKRILQGGENPFFLFSKDLGYSLLDVISWNDWSWVKSSAKSFYGVFGYMKFPCSSFVYNIALILVLLPLLFFALLVFLKSNFENKCILLLAFSFCFLGILQSMFFSWTVGFQAQGRYIFGIIPICMLAYAVSDNGVLKRELICGWLLLITVLHTYSYVNYCIVNLN